MEKRSESFGRLLKAGISGIAAIEGKTQQAVETELGDLIGVAGVTLQRYKTGYLPPEPASIELLAEACVQRGLLGQRWLERFLEAGRLSAYTIRGLAARLFPSVAQENAPVTKPNLPPPTYARFIMRDPYYKQIMAGLRSALPITLVVSLGGMGKTSLARAIAGECLAGNPAVPEFAAVVWVSDKDRFGTTNLSNTLDTIARVLDYPGLIALSFHERLREIAQLLRGQPVLLVIDNAETITDTALFDWLKSVPEPSKVLVTSRVSLPALEPSYLVPVGPMTLDETRALMADWFAKSHLRGLGEILDQLMPIAGLVGGNPKAIELALGLIQHRSLDDVTAALSGAESELFNGLFKQAWELLAKAACAVLSTLTFFPGSASVDALTYCVDLSSAAFTNQAEHLTRLSLVDVERSDIRLPPRYNAHALIRAYAHTQFARLPVAEQYALRERWLGWCLDIARSVGFCWDHLERLDLLDEEYEVIQAALEWAVQQHRDSEIITLVEGIRYYYNVRGLWSEVTLRNNQWRAEAAHRLGDRDQEILAYAHLVQILSKQGRHTDAAAAMEALVGLGDDRYHRHLDVAATDPAEIVGWTDIRKDVVFEYGHARAHYALAQGDFELAKHYWHKLLSLSSVIGGQKYVVNRRWLATVAFQEEDISTAHSLFEESLHDAYQIDDVRSVSGNLLKLARIDLVYEYLNSVEEKLEKCRLIATRYRDRRRLAECHFVAAQLFLKRGEIDKAQGEFVKALDLFERLGMRREVMIAQALLKG